MYKRRFFDFVVFSNIFIAVCAVLMACYTTHLFTGHLPPLNFTAFVFFSTLASYSIHWYLTDAGTEITEQRTPWLGRNKRTHLLFFIVSAVGCGFLLLQELAYIKWILPAVLLTFIYTAPKIPFPPFTLLRNFIYAKTLLLALMWAYVTSALPLLLLDEAWQSGYTLFFINRFLLIFAICIPFDLRDREFDKAGGVKSLVTLLSPVQIRIVFNACILLNLLATVWLHQIRPQTLVENFILLIPTALTFLLYRTAIKTKDDYLFYFILDGLMALSPILHFLAICLNVV
ncbi:hypothetical protein GCM10027051_12300 [Niabella terrae]